MAGLFDKQVEFYAEARPRYPKEWYSKLASVTPHHRLAWDVATGNGQAAIGVAEHYDQVIGTDLSEAQLKHSIPHPKIRYIHTPLSTSEQDFVSLLQAGEEGSVDLVTVAQAVHWFDLPTFYSVVNRVLRKPGGVFAVWVYNKVCVTPEVDAALEDFQASVLPYRNPKWVQYVMNGYRTLPFPFESVGLGSEGEPVSMDIEKEVSFDGLVRRLRSSSAVVTAKEQGVDLLSEQVVKGLETAWGGASLIRKVTYKAFMLAGTPKF